MFGNWTCTGLTGRGDSKKKKRRGLFQEQCEQLWIPGEKDAIITEWMFLQLRARSEIIKGPGHCVTAAV